MTVDITKPIYMQFKRTLLIASFSVPNFSVSGSTFLEKKVLCYTSSEVFYISPSIDNGFLIIDKDLGGWFGVKTTGSVIYLFLSKRGVSGEVNCL